MKRDFEIRTGRLVIKPLGMKYLDTVNEYTTDPENTKLMMFLPFANIDETIKFLKKCDAMWENENDENYECAILLEDVQIGEIWLEIKDKTAELGWILNKKYWGRGYVTEAAGAVRDYAIRELGVLHFWACCDSENAASYSVMKKLGMHLAEKTKGRKNKLSPEGEDREELLFRLDVDNSGKAYFHLPGLFEYYELYKIFLPLFYGHRKYFYDWCEIGSVYGAPADCLWGGGRVGFGDDDAEDVLALLSEYDVSARLTFSNSLLEKQHLTDKKCNKLCELLAAKQRNSKNITRDGVIVHSDLLSDYLSEKYSELCQISSTTKVITDFNHFLTEVQMPRFDYVVPDFRLNKRLEDLGQMKPELKGKVEFLCNECCSINCQQRKKCYENVSRKSLGQECEDHKCLSDAKGEGYVFSKAMENPAFIGIKDIENIYLPMGFANFKLEGRGLGSAVVLEMLLYYMTKPEYQLKVREAVYLDSMLDLF